MYGTHRVHREEHFNQVFERLMMMVVMMMMMMMMTTTLDFV